MNPKEIEELGDCLKDANARRDSLLKDMKRLEEQRNALSSKVDLLVVMIMAEARKIDTLERAFLAAVEQEKTQQIVAKHS